MKDAAAFAALQAIEEGEWDRFLHRLLGAINMRRQTDEYRAHIVAGLAAIHGGEATT